MGYFPTFSHLAERLFVYMFHYLAKLSSSCFILIPKAEKYSLTRHLRHGTPTDHTLVRHMRLAIILSQMTLELSGNAVHLSIYQK